MIPMEEYMSPLVSYVSVLLDSIEYLPPHWKTPAVAYGVVQTLVAATLLNVCFALGLFVFHRTLLRQKGTPPFEGVPLAPDVHWLVGHAYAIWDYRMSLTAKFNRLFVDVVNEMGLGSVYMGFSPFLVVTRAEDVQTVLRTSSTTALSLQVRRHYARRAGGHEALAHLAQGKVWKAKRQFVHKVFMRNLENCTEGFIKVAYDLSAAMLAKIRHSGCRTVKGGPMTFLFDMERLTTLAMFDNFGVMAFGSDFECCKNLREHKISEAIAFQFDDFERRVKDVFNPASQLYSIPTPHNLRRRTADETIRSFYRGKIHERLAGTTKGNQTDVLSCLKTHLETSKEATIDSAVELLQTLFNGATTTSAGTLMFALYAVSLDSTVEERCLEEIDRVIGPRHKNNRKFNPKELHYCRAVIMETVRLYPSIPVNTRVMEVETEVGGKTFAPGTKVIIPVFSVQRDARHFPKPTMFIPERWVQRKKDGSWDEVGGVGGGEIAPANLEAFVAFSSGGRNCVGQRLAVYQTTIALAILIRDLQFKVQDKYVMDLYYEGITMRPRHGMPMECTERCEICS